MSTHQTEPESFVKPNSTETVADKPYNSNPFTLAFDAFGRFFETNKDWAIFLIIMGILSFLVQGVSTIADIAASNSSPSTVNDPTFSAAANSPDATVVVALIVGIASVVIFVGAIAVVVNTYINGMLAYVALQSEQGKKVSLGEAFRETSQRFWRLLWASILAGLKIFGWSLLFIIPGIIASLRYKLLSYTIMSQSADEKGVIDAHTTTKQITKGRLLEVLSVGIIGSIIPVIGGIIGLAGHAAQFNQLNYAYQNKSEKPPIHWLNKLFLGLIIAIALFVLLAIVLIIALVASSN